MKKMRLLTKTLLIAAVMCLGSMSAWAQEKEYTTIYSNDYETPSTISDILSGDYKDCQIEDGTNHYLKVRENLRNGGSKTMTFPSYSTTDCQEYVLSFKVGFYTSNNKGSSFQLRNGNTALATFSWTGWSSNTVSYTIGSTAQNETLTSVYQNSTSRNSDTYNSITTWYTFTITGSEENSNVKLTVNNGTSDVISNSIISNTFVTISNLYFTLGNAHAEIGFDNMELKIYSENEIVPNPSASITGVNGTERTVTMTLGAGSKAGTVIKYFTDTESRSDLTTYSAPFTVTTTSAIYYYAESTTGATSDEQTINVTCEALTLNSPLISRTGNTVTISSDQTNLASSPVATIYYSYNGSTPAVYSSPITVVADATVSAYAVAEGFTQSVTASRAVALFPTEGITQIEDTPTQTSGYTAATRGEEFTVNDHTYSALLLDGNQWGTNVYLQSTDWGYRNNGRWYVNSTSDTWLLMKSMTAGDIVVINSDYPATNMVNATYCEKYSTDSESVYYVSADGDVEFALKKPNSKTMHYLYGIYAYTITVTGTAIGATDNSTNWKGATTDHVTLKPGDSYHYQFINYNNGANFNDQNWQLIVANANDDADVMEIRADWWENLTTNTNHQIAFSSDATNYWTNYPSKMNGAAVEMTVTFNTDKTFTMSTTTTASDGTTWTYNFESNRDNTIDLTGNNALTIYLTVAKNWLDLTSEAKTAVGATVGSSEWATLYTPYALNFSGVTDLTAYTATCDGSTVTLTEVTDVPANTGVVLNGTAGTYSIPVIASSTTSQGSLKGSATEDLTYSESSASDYYMLALNADGVVRFTKLTSGTIAAGKAYLEIPNGSGARVMNVVFGNATGVKELKTSGTEEVKSVYSLSGQRVSKPTKGLYIVNGKKVMVK